MCALSLYQLICHRNFAIFHFECYHSTRLFFYIDMYHTIDSHNMQIHDFCAVVAALYHGRRVCE